MPPSSELNTPLPNMRSRNHRGRLAWHVCVLIGLCALPLAGLAMFFLSTGLHREIAVADLERDGLRHVKQTVEILQRTVRLTWSEAANDAGAIREIDKAIAALDSVHTSLAVAVNRAPVTFLAAPTADEPDVHVLWQEVKAAPPGTPNRTAALRRFVERLNDTIFHTSDRTGLSAGPENEISALTDIVAVSLPLHVERLLHMHERMMPTLKTWTWNGPTREAATIFAREIEKEDIKRLNRSVTAALDADARSGHVLESFQRHFPERAEALLSGLRRLATAIHPFANGTETATAPQEFDEVLHTAFDSAITGWHSAIHQLDALIADQIAEAESHRNQALVLAGVVSALLVPIGWGYFRFFIRPVVVTMVDEAVDNRRAAEAARAEADESTRRLRQTQAALDDHSAVTVVDLQQRIVAINDRMCRLSGYTREELLHQPFAALAPADVEASPWADIWSAVARGAAWHGSLPHRAKDGHPFWVDATLFPFLDRSGKPVEFVVIETDITELTRARESAESAARAKSQFLAMMSHEIRTPMNGVIGFAQLLADTRLDDQQRDYARTILTSGESLLVIINDILDFSKLEAGRTELELRPVSLRLLIEDVLDLLATQARAKNIELVYWLDPHVPDGILGDGPRLRQVLLNLTGNAVKFTAAGHVQIRVEPAVNEAERFRFHVVDTGMGIPAERVDRLFKAFSQVDASISRTHGGTGLGLAISQRLVGLMGGQIAVRSVPGEGSDFHFTLPLTAADVSEEMRARASTLAAEADQALGGRRILVVDDLEANRRLLQVMLTRHGAHVTLARSSKDALERLDEGKFDLAVLDYMMPEVDGLALAKQIRARDRGCDLPLLLATSVKLDTDAGTDRLFDSVILKPVRAQPFVAAAMRAVRKTPSAAPAPSTTPTPAADFASKHPLRIAVVDDNPVNLKVMAATLRSLGYTPAIFNEAAVALGRWQEEKFDVILMDVQMPGMDGLEATRRLRAGAAGDLNRATRIVALTAGAMAEERAACLAAGMEDFMAKPVPRAELLEKLAAAHALVRGQA